MIRIESTNPATSSRVSGVAFVPHPNPERATKVSAVVAEDIATRLCGLPGYSRCSLSDEDAAAVDAAIEKLAQTEALGPNGTVVSTAERTVGELQGTIQRLSAERDQWRRKAEELERAGTPEAAKRLSADVTRLTTEVERLTADVASRDATITKLQVAPPSTDDATTKKDIEKLEKKAGK